MCALNIIMHKTHSALCVVNNVKIKRYAEPEYHVDVVKPYFEWNLFYR